MPELPEVETVVRGLRETLADRCIASVELRRKNLRIPFPKGFAKSLEGRRVLGIFRRAKYILVSLDGGNYLLVHLGMTGRFTVLPAKGTAKDLGRFYEEASSAGNANGRHDHVVFTLDQGTRIVYSDHRRFGLMDLVSESQISRHKLLKDIGVEPLGNDFSAGYLAVRFAGKKAPLKSALLDQRIIAGLGNIYACEALHRTKLSPKRRAGTLVRCGKPDERLEFLVRHIRNVLTEAIAAGGSTLQDFAHTDGESGAFQQRFAVYDREGEPCPGCGKPIKRLVQSGRSTFYCAACQK